MESSKNELPSADRTWAAKPGPVKFFAALRRHLENGGKAQGILQFRNEPLTVDEREQLSEMFGIGQGVITAESVNLRRVRNHLIKSGRTFDGLVRGVLGDVQTRRQSSHQKRTRKRLDVAQRRFDLLTVMRADPHLDVEYALLLDLPVEAANHVSPGTKTKAKAWKPYERAIRASVVWRDLYEREQGPVPEGELCAKVFGEVKSRRSLGGAARLAFENLTGLRYEEAVESAETCIRLAGPLVWHLGYVVANAQIARPWIGVPSRSVRELGRTDGDPAGVLLVENQETFERLCKKTTVTQRWLCIWTEGYAGDDLIEFIKLYGHLPVAASCDLDPHGIGIVQDLISRTGIDVEPTCMDVEIWRRTEKRKEKKLETAALTKDAARKLKDTCIEVLRPLAVALAETGERVEQEQIDDLFEIVSEQLDWLELKMLRTPKSIVG